MCISVLGKIMKNLLNVLACTCNPNTGDIEVGKLQFCGQPRLQQDSISKKQRKK